MLVFLLVSPRMGFYIRGMIHKKVIVIALIILVAAAVLVASLWLQFGSRPTQELTGARIKVGDSEYSVELAETVASQTRGLSGRESLPERGGMLFVFKQPEPRMFWMYQMKFPIDIVWIREGRVIGVSKNAPVPTGMIPASFPSPGPADMVLEIVAGAAERDGIVVGARVEFSR